MSAIRYIWPAAVLAAFLVMPQIPALAQDDQTPEQKEEMQLLMEREKVAVEEKAASSSYASPDTKLMEEKEGDRAKMMKEEEADATRYQGRGWRNWR